jgi:hypothetical protein
VTDTRAIAHLVCCDANIALCGQPLTGGDDYADDDGTPLCQLCALVDEWQRPCGDPDCEVGVDEPDDHDAGPAENPSWKQPHARRPVERLHLSGHPGGPRPATAAPVKRHPPLRGTDRRHNRPGRRRET